MKIEDQVVINNSTPLLPLCPDGSSMMAMRRGDLELAFIVPDDMNWNTFADMCEFLRKQIDASKS